MRDCNPEVVEVMHVCIDEASESKLALANITTDQQTAQQVRLFAGSMCCLKLTLRRDHGLDG